MKTLKRLFAKKEQLEVTYKVTCEDEDGQEVVYLLDKVGVNNLVVNAYALDLEVISVEEVK